MSALLTIRNLAAPVKHKLRMQAASHGRSMEAEARAILAASLATDREKPEQTAARAERRKRIDAVIGIWENRVGGKPTNEIMRELRGDD